MDADEVCLGVVVLAPASGLAPAAAAGGELPHLL